MPNLHLCDLDLNKNQLLKAVVHKAGTAPATPEIGQIYYDTGDDTMYVCTAEAPGGGNTAGTWLDLGDNSGDITGVTFIADGGSNLVTASGAVSLDIAGGTGITTAATSGTITANIDAAQAGITSIINASLTKIGTAANQEYLTFGTSNEVNTFVNNTERLSVTASGVDITGALTVSGSYGLASGDIPNNAANTSGTAAKATHVLVSDNESANEENEITFVEDAAAGGAQRGLESSAKATFNPSSGNITATGFVGKLTIGAHLLDDVNVNTEFVNADDTIMSAKAIGHRFSLKAGSTSIVTTGVLNAGSINTSFGVINNGGSAITTTGLISGGSLDIDDVLINGSNIGHTDDTDLIALADGAVTVNGSLTVTGTTTTNNVETVSTSSGVVFEGTGADGIDATLKSVVAGNDKTYTLPNTTGFIGIFTTDPGTTNVTATTAELNALDLGSTAVGNAIASKAVVLDTNKDFTGLNSITSDNFVIGSHTINDVDLAGQFVDSSEHLLTSAAALDKFHVLNADTTGNADTATNLVVSTSSVVSLGSIEMGDADDTTIARSAAGRVTIEGQQIATSKSYALAHATTGVAGDTSSANGNKVFTITHGMGNSLNYMVQVIAASGGATVFPCVTRTTSTVVITFNAIVAASAYTALLVKI